MKSAEIDQILSSRLEAMGIASNHIPRFMKDILNSFFINPQANVLQINDRLRFLGWDEAELDYYTFSLAKESLER